MITVEKLLELQLRTGELSGLFARGYSHSTITNNLVGKKSFSNVWLVMETVLFVARGADRMWTSG